MALYGAKLAGKAVGGVCLCLRCVNIFFLHLMPFLCPSPLFSLCTSILPVLGYKDKLFTYTNQAKGRLHHQGIVSL